MSIGTVAITEAAIPTVTGTVASCRSRPVGRGPRSGPATRACSVAMSGQTYMFHAVSTEMATYAPVNGL